LIKKIIFSFLFALCIISLQTVYAETEFAFKFGTTGTGNNNLNDPTDVIVDKNGKNIYVVDSNNDRIIVLENDGDYDFKYGTFCDIAIIQNCNDNADGANVDGDGQFNNPISIAIDALGKFFVIDSANFRVQIFDKDGEFQSKFGSSNSAIDEYLGSAKGITIQESSKNILISNTESDSISVFDSTGDYLFKFDSFNGNDDFTNPSHMVIDNSNEMLFVSDSSNDRIIIFELVTGTTCPSGTVKSVNGVCFVKEFGTSGTDEGEFDNPTGLAYDSTNDLLFVADSDNDRIQIFKIIDGTVCPSGTQEIVDGVCYVEEIGSTGSGNGNFNTPIGVAHDSINDLLIVADSDNDRIQAFDLNSEPEILIPSKPINLKASPISPTSIIISWDKPEMAENIPAISGYKIEYKVGSGNYLVLTENTASTSSSFIHQGLDSDETYSYRVYSINSVGKSISSSSVSVKPQHTTTPTAVTASAISPNQIKLKWLPPSETFGQVISGYEIKREVIAGVYDTVGNTDSKTTSFIVSGLTTDKTYSYAISAVIGFGSTGESVSASATPREDSVDTSEEPIMSSSVQITVSTPPIKLTASAVSSTQINLAWSPPAEDGNSPITGYKIEVKKDSNAYTTLIADSKSTTRTYSHTNVIKDSKYTYRVSAINSAGISEPSNEFSTTPRSNNVKINPIGKLTIDEGKLLSFTVKLVDNSVKDAVFTLENNPPTGAKIISNTGMFSWTPTSSDGGKTYTFDIVAKKDGISDKQTITVTVNDSLISPPITEPEPTPTEPKELGIASFVDKTKDPQSYVDRYNKEPSYKKWFDDNFPEYDSIYQAVGLDEPEIKEKKFGICGPGTKLIEGVCTIIKKPVVKPWWQFW